MLIRGNKKSKWKNYDFETSYPSSLNFTKICRDMQNSKAWKELSLRQQGLYLHLKSKFTVYKTSDTNQNDISIPKNEAIQLYGDLRTFRKDIDKLIELGFIKQTCSGWNTRTANLYGFSDKWKLYGTEKFYIPNEDKRYISPNTYKPISDGNI